MKTSAGHLTYCTNIHTGESWNDHLGQLKKYVPAVKERLSPDGPFGIGLRLSNQASVSLAEKENLDRFREWLGDNDCYVFTMNGFPYGGFHHLTVKDNVHKPDWTTEERTRYTLRLFDILAGLLPAGTDGGISTSPLSYKLWYSRNSRTLKKAGEDATHNIIRVLRHLIEIRNTGGLLLHLDIEPEPDGLISDSHEFINWYKESLIPAAVPVLRKELGMSVDEIQHSVREHITLCYDVCHFAVGYEKAAEVLPKLRKEKIRIGKIQLSAALKTVLPDDIKARSDIFGAFQAFNESTYLHQVIARTSGGSYIHYADLPPALDDLNNPEVVEWRSHFHVPLFIDDFGKLQSTGNDVAEIMRFQIEQNLTNHLEVETYTWGVLPPELRVDMAESITRELEWINDQIQRPGRSQT